MRFLCDGRDLTGEGSAGYGCGNGIQGGNKCHNPDLLGFVKNDVFKRFMGGEALFCLFVDSMKGFGGASKVMRQFPCSRQGADRAGALLQVAHPSERKALEVALLEVPLWR